MAEEEASILMSAMQALALLAPEVEACSELAARIVEGMRPDEKTIVREFFRNGQRCLARLSGAVLNDLKLLTKGNKAINVGRSRTFKMPSEDDDKPESRAIYQLFDEFDRDKDGLLSASEFKEAFRRLAGESMSDAQVERLMKVADVSGDGMVDIHEFSVWLYSGTGSGSLLKGGAPAEEKKDSAALVEDCAALVEDCPKDWELRLANLEKEFPSFPRRQLLAALELKDGHASQAKNFLKAAGQEKLREGEKEKKVDWEANCKALRKQLQEAEAELLTKKRAINHLEDVHEEEMDATHDFWKEAAKTCIMNIDQTIDLAAADWLGNGKYGFVLKATRRTDGREVVVKMMGVRWAHLAVKEWQYGSMVGKHPTIVDYEQVMLHADEDHSVLKMLEEGYDRGVLHGRTKRKKYPDRFICLTVELMNQGTVQDWMDRSMLLPSGIFAVMQSVAEALAFMHKKGITHNDIKPENVMMHQENDNKMLVKLGDLGLADKSRDTAADFWQYGMTAFCMVTGEKFGSRKYKAENIDEFVGDCQSAIDTAGYRGSTAETMAEVPKLLKAVFNKEVGMSDIRDNQHLRSWSFYDSDAQEEEYDFDEDEDQHAALPVISIKSARNGSKMVATRSSRIDEPTMQKILSTRACDKLGRY